MHTFLFLLLTLCQLTIKKQTGYYSVICSDNCTWFEIPKYCHVGSEKTYKVNGSEYIYLNRSVALYKPLRKIFEYDGYYNEGILINSEGLMDKITYPDLSTQMLCISITGALTSLVFKLYGG